MIEDGSCVSVVVEVKLQNAPLLRGSLGGFLGLQRSDHPPRTFYRVCTNFAFPKPEYGPTVCLGGAGRASVPFLIAFELRHPVAGVGTPERLPAVSRASVPEAAVNENGNLLARECEVSRNPWRDSYL